MVKKKNKDQKAKRALIRVPRNLPPYSNATAPPTAYGGLPLRKDPLPLMMGASGGMKIQNYEQIATFANGSGPGFTGNGFVCNPGVLTSFPWLAALARSYQKFRWHYLRFLYVPAVPTTTAGNSWIFLEYDYQDTGPTTIAQVSVSNEAALGPVWQGGPVDPEIAFRRGLQVKDCMHVDVDVRNLTQPWYYVRNDQLGVSPSSGGVLSGVIPAGLTFTQGSTPDPAARPVTCYYGTNGVSNTITTAGYLYAAYQIEFTSPVAPALTG